MPKKKPIKKTLAIKREKIEKEKHLAMWSGVGFFMILIIFIWVINFKNNFNIVNKKPAQNARDKTMELKNTVSNLNKILEDTKNNFAELRDTVKNPPTVAGIEGQVQGVKVEPVITEEMKKRIELEKMMFELNKGLKKKY